MNVTWFAGTAATFTFTSAISGSAGYLFARYGGRVVFVARFVAFLRALAGLLAGINRMEWKRFMLFSGLGAAVWALDLRLRRVRAGTRGGSPVRTRAGVLIALSVIVAAIAGFRFILHNRSQLQREADQFADR